MTIELWVAFVPYRSASAHCGPPLYETIRHVKPSASSSSLERKCQRTGRRRIAIVIGTAVALAPGLGLCALVLASLDDKKDEQEAVTPDADASDAPAG